LVLAAVLVLIAGAAFGWTQDAALWKPLRRRGTGIIPMMIVTIGLSLFARSVLQAFYGSSPRSFPHRSEIVAIGPTRLSVYDYISMGVAASLLIIVAFVLMRTRWGKATRAVSDNPALAAASGINVDQVRIACFAGLSSTATTSRSKVAAARRITSRWPLVSGSKLPGHTAAFATSRSLHRGDGRRGDGLVR
jgi:branched-subunit amino acid ABC-type transport system permease component